MSSIDTTLEILRLEDARYQAMLAADTDALEQLLDDALVYSHSSGVADTKQSYIAGVRDQVWEYLDIARSDQSVVIRGDAALVFNRLRISLRVSGVPRNLDNSALAVWSRASGAWRLLAVQSSALPKS